MNARKFVWIIRNIIAVFCVHNRCFCGGAHLNDSRFSGENRLGWGSRGTLSTTSERLLC
ncbi:hypothetical protein M758_5G029600 [Ceratodon purpureus]|nr:hypothetical protein M758_5G029600 [Ceratodon purpureus]